MSLNSTNSSRKESIENIKIIVIANIANNECQAPKRKKSENTGFGNENALHLNNANNNVSAIANGLQNANIGR